MKKSILSIGFVLISLSIAVCQQSITTFILLRHAEKAMDNTDDPDLKPEGAERARRLVEFLSKTPVDAIYSTPLKRTRNTVGPLATARGLEIKVYEAFKEAPIDQILKDYPGGTVVISGHSNNIPWIANLLTGTKKFEEYSENDFSNLLVVDVVMKGKAAKVTWLRY